MSNSPDILSAAFFCRIRVFTAPFADGGGNIFFILCPVLKRDWLFVIQHPNGLVHYATVP